MRNAPARLLAALLLVAVVALLELRAQSPAANDGQRFQEAVTLMDVRRDYATAIRLFEAVASGTDRRLAARALVYIGICHERLGQAEARKAYQRVIKEFPDQPVAVRDAEARLAALGAPVAETPAAPRTVTLRQAWAGRPPNAYGLGEMSADGRWFPVLQYGEDGPVVLLETSTGRLSDRPFLLNPATSGGQRACPGHEPGPPSPDGREIAYVCYVADKRQELRVVTLDGTVRTLLRTEPEHTLEVKRWTATGTLVGLLSGPDRRPRLLLVSARDGATRQGPDLPAPPRTVALSPDERWLAYDNPSANGDDDDVYIARVADGPSRVLLGGASDDRHPVWTPDGHYLLFVSDRAGTSGLWVLRVADGQPLDEPRVLQQDVGRVVRPFGITAAGEYLYFRQLGFPETYAVRLDAHGNPDGAPVPLSRAFAGSNMYPTWSPDASEVAFVSRLGVRSRAVIGVRNMRSDAQRSLQTGLVEIHPVHWSPDGRTLLAYGRDTAGQLGFFAVDASTGATAPILRVAAMDESRLAAPAWSADGSAIYYAWRAAPEPLQMRRRAVTTGDEAVVFTLPRGHWVGTDTHLAVSHATGAVAVTAFQKDGSSLFVHTADGLRTVLSTIGTDRLLGVGWLPDGRHVIVSRLDLDDASQQGALWRVDTETGVAIDLGVRMHALRDLQVSRDGSHVAFTAGEISRETWVLSNFLPAATEAATPRRRAVRRR
jgi:Tol biopolymer transport system component